MFLYNVTLIVEDVVAEEWLQWMEKVHVPQIMATGKFITHKLWRIIDSPNEGVTYSNQFFFEDLENYADFLQNYSPKFEEEIRQKYGESVMSFTSTMQDVL
jgi:hypothetical protein